MPTMSSFVVSAADDDKTLAAFLRQQLDVSWTSARTMCERHKVSIDGHLAADPARRVRVGQQISIDPNAKRPLAPAIQKAQERIIFEDSQLLVVNKPAGISSVPYERDEKSTAMDLIRDAWRAQGRKATDQPLYVVHRIDKDTSGLLMFAKTRPAERELQQLFRHHDIRRRYLCVAHGYCISRTIESYLIKDRGDGLRGSLAQWKVDLGHGGRLALTHLEVTEHIGTVATVCSVQIETGKTHQIRIHLAEAGHPIVGERVYIRDFTRRGQTALPCSRLLLHAETLGFVHPITGEDLMFQQDPPLDFSESINRLRSQARKEQAALQAPAHHPAR
jgi:23S rRNA pseudouridine1911/1915/1917 synthase